MTYGVNPACLVFIHNDTVIVCTYIQPLRIAGHTLYPQHLQSFQAICCTGKQVIFQQPFLGTQDDGFFIVGYQPSVGPLLYQSQAILINNTKPLTIGTPYFVIYGCPICDKGNGFSADLLQIPVVRIPESAIGCIICTAIMVIINRDDAGGKVRKRLLGNCIGLIIETENAMIGSTQYKILSALKNTDDAFGKRNLCIVEYFERAV
ncbi:hypothetical protein D3C72_678240 [compost metagenome]